jgi:hypothetical protein
MAENTSLEEGYCVREITTLTYLAWNEGKNTPSSVDIVHLARLPENEGERRIMEKNLKRIGELEAEKNVKQYQEISSKPEFQRSSQESRELNELENSKEVKEFMDLSIYRTIAIGDSATITSQRGRYSVGQVIDKNTAEKDIGFKSVSAKSDLSLIGGHGSGRTE